MKEEYNYLISIGKFILKYNIRKLVRQSSILNILEKNI